MLNATLAPARPAHTVAPSLAVAGTARRLSDAVAEFDRALEQGLPMYVLVRLDQEVSAADRGHRAALSEAARRA